MKRSEMPDWAWVIPYEEDDEVVEYRYESKSGTHHGFHHKYMRDHNGIITGLHPGFKDTV